MNLFYLSLEKSVPDRSITHYCNLLCRDQPNNKKRGAVCMCYKEYLHIKKKGDLSNLKECLVTEVIMDKKKIFSCLYNSPRQTEDALHEF